jgi:hypothetical protein
MGFFNKEDYEGKGERKLDELFDQACRQGAVLAVFHFDAHGQDAEKVKTTLVEFASRISKESGLVYCKGEIDTNVLEKDGMFSTTAEVKLLAESLRILLDLSLKYGPVAIEILKPNEVRLTIDEVQNLLVDASLIAQEYASFIIQHSLKGQDLEDYKKRLERRSELGKELMQESEKK